MSLDLNLLHVEFSYYPLINYSTQQNKIPVVRSIRIENQSDKVLNNISVILNFEPEFAKEVRLRADAIAPNGTLNISTPKINLSTEYFAQLTERETGGITLSVFSEEKELYSEIFPIDALSFDQWGGTSIIPELLAAFVTPNHPGIPPLVRRAAGILEGWTGNPSLDEYQSRDPNRVRAQVAALYAAISEQNIVYSSVPASFEEYGQRIRTVDKILNEKLGNCLDMTLLYASCMEAVGIHPLIIITKDHAFVGAWLESETFPDNAIDDYTLITKRAADGINEIVLIEATNMNKGNRVEFDIAVDNANQKIGIRNNFQLAVDVKRSRSSGIRPLPQRILEIGEWKIAEEPDKFDDLAVPAKVSRHDLTNISSDIEVTKQLLWERKLLDLSLRNNLLNTRITRNTIQLISADLDIFEDSLAAGDEFRVLHKPSELDNSFLDFGIYHSPSDRDPIIELIKSEMSQKRLRSFQTELELQRSLTHLYRTSRTAMEENGANTLYVALGLLQWHESENSERTRYAPLLLLPVEIIRKSAARGYVLKSREEETVMNITLLEMLRQNFGISINGLDPLPCDESGVDVGLIFSIIRDSIKNQKKWDVREETVLGIFSFNKFIMWNDTHNNADKLAGNKIVHSLINSQLKWEINEQRSDASVLDREMSPTDIILPISADSSQLEAIYDAVNGESFVLHGPPGTGKSQTITNIIANALYRGQRVLFVAEKMAALSVVQSRLEAIGLAPFCLEVHSNKTSKSAVVGQLKRAIEADRGKTSEEFEKEADRLGKLRARLNQYVDSLHRKYPFGFSLYDAIAKYLSIEIGEDLLFEFPLELYINIDSDAYKYSCELVDRLASIANACGHLHNNPLDGINILKFDTDIEKKAVAGIKEHEDILTLLINSYKPIVDLVDDKSDCTLKELNAIVEVVEILMTIPELTPSMMRLSNVDKVLSEILKLVIHGEERDRLKDSLLRSFNESLFSLDGQDVLREWEEAEQKWFIPKLLHISRLQKLMLPHLHDKSFDKKKLKSTLEILCDYQTHRELLEEDSERNQGLFGQFGKANKENWEIIKEIVACVRKLNSLIIDYTKDISKTTEVKNKLAYQLTEGVDAFKALYKEGFDTLYKLIKQYTKSKNNLIALLNLEQNYLDEKDGAWIANSQKTLKRWRENIDKISDWYQLLEASRELRKIDMGVVVDNFRDLNIPINLLRESYEKSFMRSAIKYIITQNESLRFFKGQIFNDDIERYKELIGLFERLTRQELYARLLSRRPRLAHEAVRSSEVGILQRNIKNNARGISIRKFFDMIPNLLPKISPCMLMSPISVAQYIDVDAEKFDLVIFDEASQVPTCDAVGAIARGENLIVVGDPEQLPPTSFFAVNTFDEDNIEIEDMESILDDCLAISMPSKYLEWHYRSRHESLIAFSNAEYYNNRLMTFPSPDNIESKVIMVSVEGYYDRGRTRQNRAEADAIIAEIKRRLSDKELNKKSIGVVTFSSVQQNLIEDLLTDLFIKEPELDAIASNGEEPLFVKNLENVQGDERDVILFSICYGPDDEGVVSMNFGPINREGGERRLNVAVSRSRYEMMIFSTMSSDMIDLRRTRSKGVAGLKHFLEYAESGERFLRNKSNGAFDYSDTVVELIAKELRAEGYKVDTNVGCSGYRVDIGVVDKKNHSRYKLGVLCDGDVYKKTKTTRDREVIQNSVLKGLGWSIHRVWTMDWWENPKAVISNISELIENTPEETFCIAEEDIPKVDCNNNNSMVLSALKNLSNVETAEVIVSKEDDYEDDGTMTFNDKNEEPYHITELEMTSIDNSDMFFELWNRENIVSQLNKVISTEAPISRELLYRRVLSAWGIGRLGSRLTRYLGQLVSQQGYYFHNSYTETGDVFWKNIEHHESYNKFRCNSGRTAQELPPEEVANAIRSVVELEISLPTEDMIRATAQRLGFSRIGNNIESIVEAGLKNALKRNLVIVADNRVIVK